MEGTAESNHARVRPWKLRWRPEHVSAFWDWKSTRACTYFSEIASHAIYGIAAKYIPFEGLIADYGCGPGHFIAKLVSKRVQAIGLDVSPESITAVRTRFAQNPEFKGAYLLPTEVEALHGRVSALFMIESIEHMDDDALHCSFEMIRRLLRPEGYIVVTTPNDEELENSEVFCPNCGSVFHRMQHQRSWTMDSLVQHMRTEGFERVACHPYHTYELSFPLGLLQRVWRHLRFRKPPNLIYIGVRQS
jgi:SAM-dependent methyltransferase